MRQIYMPLDDFMKLTNISLEGLEMFADEFGLYARDVNGVVEIDIVDFFYTYKSKLVITENNIHKNDIAFYKYVESLKKKES